MRTHNTHTHPHTHPHPQELNIRPTLSDQTLQYVRALERKIRQLELQAVDANGIGDGIVANGRPEAVVRALQILEVREQIERDRTVGAGVGSGGGGDGSTSSSGSSNGVTSGNGLMGGEMNGIIDDNGGGELSAGAEHMDDGEKALVREMCNVVWRKLEDSPGGGSGLE